MRTPLKLAAFGGALAITFFAALGAGSLLGDPAAATEENVTDENQSNMMDPSGMDPSDMAEHR